VHATDIERVSRIVNRPWIPDSSFSNATPSPMRANAHPGIAGTMRGRLIRGFGATALGPVVTAIVQIVSVPLFLHVWGAKLYGKWLIISAIPNYLALSDMGFATAACNDITMRVIADDRETWARVMLHKSLCASAVVFGEQRVATSSQA
jgi:hypothetical protein